MKTKFNQVGSWRTMETFAVLIGLFISSTMCVVAPALPVVETMPVILRPGVSGAEIQSALDALPASGGRSHLAAGKIEVRQPLFCGAIIRLCGVPVRRPF